MDVVLLTELRHKEGPRRWKQWQAIWEEHKDFACTCWSRVCKAKAQLEVKLAREVKGNKKGFYKYIGSKRKGKEHVGPLLEGAGDLMTGDMRKDKVLKGFFSSAFTGKACP